MCFFGETSRSHQSSRHSPRRNQKEEIYAAPRPARYAPPPPPPPYRSSPTSYRQPTTASAQKQGYSSSYATREPYNYVTVPRPIRTTGNPSKSSSKTVRYAPEPPRWSQSTARSSDATLAPVVVQRPKKRAQYINEDFGVQDRGKRDSALGFQRGGKGVAKVSG